MRVFLALSPPYNVIEQIVEWQRANAPANVHLEPASNLHMTLAFIGQVEDEMLPQLRNVLNMLDWTSINLSGAIEYREFDKLAMLVYADNGGNALVDQLNAQLATLMGFTPQFATWLPHITIWRYAPENKPNFQPIDLPQSQFNPEGAHVYTSVKNPAGGGIYTPVAKTAAPDGDEPQWGAFGWIGGQLIRADWHHQAIMAALLANGWTWEQLFTSPQCWGWYSYYKDYDRIGLRFTSDSGKQWPEEVTKAKAEFMRIYHAPACNYSDPRLPVGDSREVKDENFGKGMTGVDVRDVDPERVEMVKDDMHDPLPPPPKIAGEVKHPDYPFISFIYDDNDGSLWCLGQGMNHQDILTDRFGEDYSQQLMDMIMNNQYVFGTVWMDGSGIDLNYSDEALERAGEEGVSGYEFHREGKILDRAKSAIIDWLEANDWTPEELGLQPGYLPDWYEEPNPDQLSMTAGGWGETAQGRIVWAIDPNTDELLLSGPKKQISHAEAFPQLGYMSNGSGDILLLDDNTTVSHLFHLNEDLTNWTLPDILQELKTYVAANAPAYAFTDFQDTRKIGAALESTGAYPFTEKQIGDYTVVEMNSDEYPNHEALFIDRVDKTIIINYNGHHDPIFQNWNQYYTRGGQDFCTGHYRLEDSNTESFERGWGWHHNQPSSEELDVLTEALKEHYGVENLEDAFIEGGYRRNPHNPDGDVDGELQIGDPHWGPPKLNKFDFLENHVGGINRPKPWVAFYNAMTDHLMVTTDLSLDLGGDAKVSGFYTKVERAEGREARRARQLAEQAVATLYPLQARTAGSTQRWIIDKDGKVIIGAEESHSELIERHYGSAVAEAYDDKWEKAFDQFVTGGYIWNGEIQVVKMNGERDFDPQDVADKVYREAHNQGIQVSPKVLYRDDTRNGSPIRYFSV